MQRNDHNSTHQRNAFSSQNALANLPGFNAEVVFTNSIVRVRQFVKSYANVLSFFKTSEVTSH